MKAFAIDRFGEQGAVRDVEVPDPREGQVRVRVAAAGLNAFDNAVVQGYLAERMEHRFPLIPGMDASGTIDAIGDGVSDRTMGEEVFGSVGKSYLGEGTLAEATTMAAATLARKPASIDHSVAAAMPVAGVTALTMAETLGISQGTDVVIVGATGGVGSYLVQLAAARGGRVVAVARAENAEYARRLGAADVIDYTAGDVVDLIRARYRNIDAIADLHGDKDTVMRLAEHVRPGGRVASAVGAADTEALAQRGIGGSNVMGRVATASLETLASMLEHGDIKSPEINTFALDEAADALAVLSSRHVRGKIVVVPE